MNNQQQPNTALNIVKAITDLLGAIACIVLFISVAVGTYDELHKQRKDVIGLLFGWTLLIPTLEWFVNKTTAFLDSLAT